MNIILCGFQGVGKSYFGKLISQKLGRSFFDVDERVLEKNRNAKESSIRDLYLRVGEEEFRRQEKECVLELCEEKGAVIALGGGSLTNRESQKAVKKSGQLFYLHLPYMELYKRLQTALLPSYLSNREEAFERLFTERHSLFSQLADETIFLQAHTAEQVLDMICSYNYASG